MTTPSVGAVTQKPQLVATYTLPATIAQQQTSIDTTTAPVSPTPAQPPYVTNGNISSSPDNPAMVSVKFPVFFTQAQTEAIRSAAQNTAAAFSLPVTFAGDMAVLQSNQALLLLLKQVVVNTTDVTIIPP